MHALLHPGNVVLVGASNRPESMAFGVFETLRDAGYAGAIYPVNSRYEDVWGLRCYPSVSALPERPDHIVVMVPAASVIDVVRDAADAGAKSATIMSAGFGEGEDCAGRARRESLTTLIRESGLAVSGPNCMGNFCASSRFMTVSERRVPPPKKGSVAIAGQSGGVVIALYRTLYDRGIDASYLVTSGDELGLNAADYVRYFADCGDVRVILYYCEGLRDAHAFAEAARAATRAGKRLVVFKVGASKRGRDAAASHTGSLAGSLDAFDALIASTGAVRADTLDEMIEATEFLAHASPPSGPGIGVIVFSGGLKGIAADCAERGGVELAAFTGDTLAKLPALIGTGGSIGNPVDFGAPVGMSLEGYVNCVRAVRDDPNVDMVMLQDELLRAPGSTEKETLFRRLTAFVAEEPGKPVAMLSMLSHTVTDYGRTLRATMTNLPFLQEPAKAIRIVSRIGAAARDFRDEPPSAGVILSGARNASVVKGPANILRESEAKELLRRYGIPSPRESVARSRTEAQRAAAAIGFPCVLKVLSRTITHKSDIGGVVLGLLDEEQVGKAYDAVYENTAKAAGSDAFDGVLVAQQMQGGVELILGIKRDPEVGPILLVGIGGIFAETLADVVTAVPPVDIETSLGMIDRLRGAEILKGARGRARCDLAAVGGAVVGLGRLAIEHPQIREVDLNPLLALPEGQGVFALDALVVSD